MPKRNTEQKIKHNQSRRAFTKEGKRAIFCLNHIKNSHPDIVKEANDTYDYLLGLYPNKRNMMKTDVYKARMLVESKKSNHTPSETVTSYPQPGTSNTMANESIHPQSIVNDDLQATTTGEQKINNIEPQLRIPLLNLPLDVKDIIPQTETVNQEYTDEIIQQSTALLSELQQDPDLKWFFTDEPANNITLSSFDAEEPMSLEQEVDQIIQQEFNLTDYGLPDIFKDDDELSRLMGL